MSVNLDSFSSIPAFWIAFEAGSRDWTEPEVFYRRGARKMLGRNDF